MQKVEGGKVVTKMMKYPGVGGACEVNGLQLGGIGFGVEKDGWGKQQVTNVKHFLVPEEPVQVSCALGTLAIYSGKHNDGNGGVWCFGLGPSSAVQEEVGGQEEEEEEEEERKQGVGGKASKVASKVEEVVVPSGDKVVAYPTTYGSMGKVVKVGPLEEMFEGDEAKEDGQKNLLKLLSVDGLELFLVLGGNEVPKKPSTLQLNIFAKHSGINDGEEMLLFPMGDGSAKRGRHMGITRSGGLPGGKDWKEVAELAWSSELKDVIVKLVKPLVEFGLSLSAPSLNRKVEVGGCELPNVVKTFSRLFKEKEHSKAQEVLGCVFTRANWQDGMLLSGGLLFEATEGVKKMMVGSSEKKRKAEDAGSESESDSGADSESDSESEKEKKKQKKSAASTTPPRQSPKKRESPWSSQGKRSQGKRSPGESKKKRKSGSGSDSEESGESPKKKHKSGSGSESEESESDEDELGQEANIGSANEVSDSDEDEEVSTRQQKVKRSANL